MPRACRSAGLVLLALFTASVALPAAADESGRCGATGENLPALPLVASLPLPNAGDAKALARRKRLLEDKRACAERHPRTARYLRAILERLIQRSQLERFAAQLPSLEIALDCSIPLPIAMATTGKFMLVPLALPALAESEDAIAAVLAHELAHLTLRHTEQLMGATTGPLALTPPAARELARAHEREADVAGLRLAVNAGYDPYAAIDHMRRIEQLATDWVRTGRLPPARPDTVHDGLDARTRRLTAQIGACGYARATRTQVAPDVEAELARPELAEAAASARQ